MNAVVDRTYPSRTQLESQPVGWLRPFAWLRAGAKDLRSSLRVSAAHGFGMTLIGWLLFAVFGTDPYFVAVAVTLFLLVAPVMSTGVCEISRRLELGMSSTFDDSMAPLQREGTALLKYGSVLAVFAVGWFAVAEVLLRPLFPTSATSLAATLYGSFLEQVTPVECLAYAIAGGVLGLVVFAVSVVAIPVIIDRHAGAGRAMRTSVAVVRRHPAAMVVWAALIMALTVIGFTTLLLGMTLIIPLLGHATWRAYRDLEHR
jgi:uncharacterized membrane protein